MSALKVIGGSVAGAIVGGVLFFTAMAVTSSVNNDKPFFDMEDTDLGITLFVCCGAIVGALAAIAQVIEDHAQPANRTPGRGEGRTSTHD